MLPRLMRYLPLLAGLLLTVSMVELGNWQQRRAAEKREIQAAIEHLAASPARTLRADADRVKEWQPVHLSGVWLDAATRLIDNRTHSGQAGYHVVTPLVLEDGSGAVLVNRGWVAAGDRRQLPTIVAAEGLQDIEGVLRIPEVAPFMLASDNAGELAPVWQYTDTARFTHLLAPAHVAGWMLQQTSSATDGLVRDWPLPSAGIDRHRAYAFQWYALACLAGGLSAWYGRRLMTRRSNDDRQTTLARG